MLEFETDDMDFGRMLDGSTNELQKGFNPGQRITGVVAEITSNSVLLDINAKSEGILDRSLAEEDGDLTVVPGDTIEVYFVGMQNGEIILTTKMKSQDVDEAELHNAYEAQIPVEGKVTGVNNAGLEVEIGGVRGFCPASQVDTYHVEELSIYTGQTLTFLVLEFNNGNLVVSRRRYLDRLQEEKRGELQERLQVGDVVTGTVSKIMDFGIFVNIGVDGLIPMGEIAWERVKDASEYAKPGEQISVKVLKIDWEANRITLSLKQAGSDPWDGIEDEFRSGIAYKGTVTRLANFGAFVQLKAGVEGLVHISKLGAGRRLSHPREVVEEGQEIDVYVESIDLEQHRISLSVEKDESKGKGGGQIVAVGKEITGTVEDIKPYGAFIRLNANQSGLLHISQLEEGGNREAKLKRDYPIGAEVQVVITDARDGKISLGVPGAKEAGESIRQMMNDQKQQSSGFGSLGSLFDDL